MVPPEPARPLRVLVIEDSDASFATFRVLLNRIAQDRGDTVSIERAANADAGLALLRRGCDLALVDYHIGTVSGAELISAARAEGIHSAIIMVTASGAPTTETEAADAGANDFLPKDEINVGTLARAIRYALRNAGMQAELAHLNVELERRVAAAVAEQRQAEANLRHVEKMEAVGRATGTIAHDFRNILTVVGGNLELLRVHIADGTREARNADAALRAVASGTRLIGDLMSFSHRPRKEPQLVAPSAFLQEIGDMLRQVCGDRLTFAVDADGTLGAISVDPGELQRALLNLVSNAHDATPEGGRVSVAVRRVSAAEDGRAWMRLTVADTGEGMAPDVMRQALEPFFTTKSRKSGTGLGLSQVNEFVRESGGRIELESTEGVGTTVSLYFPEE